MKCFVFKIFLLLMCPLQCQVIPAMGQESTSRREASARSERKKKLDAEGKAAEDAALRERRSMATEALGVLIGENISSLTESAAERLFGLTELTAQSTLLLWKHDPATAAGHFKKLSETLLDLYEKDRRRKADTERLAYERRALKRVITLWGGKDVSSAVKLQQKLHELDEELNAESNPASRNAERLELAGELLDSDPQQSAGLAERVIETSFPPTFPDYLHKLRQAQPAAAARLLSKSLSILGTGQVYSFREDLYIQAYVFREPMIIYPINEPVEFPGFKSLVYPAGGVHIIKYTFGARDMPDAAECEAYAQASLSGLDKKFLRPPSLTGLDAATAYFLLQKQSAFFGRGIARPPRSLGALAQAGALFATNKGVAEPNLNHLATVANEVVAGNFLEFLKSSASAAAEQSEDASLKAGVFEKEIFGDLEARRFEPAAEKISRLEDRETREAVSDYMYVLMTRDALKKSDWNAVDAHLERLNNPGVKSYALLECARSALGSKDWPKWSQYLQAARRTIEDKLSDKEQPQMMAGLLTIFAEAHARGSEEFLFTTLEDALLVTARGINRPLDRDDPVEARKDERGVFATRYAGNDIALYSKGVTDGAIRYQLRGTGLEKAFTEAAKINWLTTYVTAREIKDRSLRGKAILGACRAVL